MNVEEQAARHLLTAIDGHRLDSDDAKLYRAAREARVWLNKEPA